MDLCPLPTIHSLERFKISGAYGGGGGGVPQLNFFHNFPPTLWKRCCNHTLLAGMTSKSSS